MKKGELLDATHEVFPFVSAHAFRPTNLSPTAPRVSAAIRSNSPASNAYAPSASHKLKSVLPAGSNDPLRKRCWTPQPTALDKYLAGLRHHLSMEERLSICMAVAKNLHDSVAARDGGRPLVQTGNCPHPSLAPPHQEIAANTSRTPCFNDRPVCSTLRINELPHQRRRVLFLIKLPVSRNLSQLVGPSTLRRFRSLGHQEVADRLEAAASQQADNQNTSTKIATKKCEQKAKRHF